ncbi:MAG: UDP-N-acetylglucosamine 1-carboxyvinyltransferase [Lachnospiraceae bacterium]
MKSVIVNGGSRLNGEVVIQGSKNLAIPCLAASILFHGTVTLHNVPDISDVRGSVDMLKCLGAEVKRLGNSLIINTENLNKFTLTCCHGGGRSSILYCGPLLARFGACFCDAPKGCKIGNRPTDLHQKIFRQFGAVKQPASDVLAYRAACWKGCEIKLPIKSVGATESAVLSAVLAEGRTEIEGYAREPEILHLCEFLVKAGADIEFIPEYDKIIINGVKKLHSCEYRLAPDRIVAGTYMIYGCMCRGNIKLYDAPVNELDVLIEILKKSGADIVVEKNFISLSMDRRPVSAGVIETDFYPGFPTDLQSLLLALEAVSEGESIIVENIFESRFETAMLLKEMGAQIFIEGNTAYIKGVSRLKNCRLYAPDLRGGAAVLGAMMSGEGRAELTNFDVVERGYENILKDISMLGFLGLEEAIENTR